ncbi:hypothetical protein FQA39_LY00462 [Lamprigera yunnana]|nr:hypothetical protein FQA39_LY00462 [Lamprigera yunnana]
MNSTINHTIKVAEVPTVDLQKSVPSTVPHVSCNVPTNLLHPQTNPPRNDRVLHMSVAMHDNHMPHMHAPPPPPPPPSMPMILNHRRDFMPLPPHGMMMNMELSLKEEPIPWMNSHNRKNITKTRGIKDKQGNRESDEKRKKDIWKEHFQSLLYETEQEDKDHRQQELDEREEENEVMIEEPTYEETKNIIARMKNRKAPESDQIKGEMMKY